MNEPSRPHPSTSLVATVASSLAHPACAPVCMSSCTAMACLPCPRPPPIDLCSFRASAHGLGGGGARPLCGGEASSHAPLPLFSEKKRKGERATPTTTASAPYNAWRDAQGDGHVPVNVPALSVHACADESGLCGWLATDKPPPRFSALCLCPPNPPTHPPTPPPNRAQITTMVKAAKAPKTDVVTRYVHVHRCMHG